ncbi:MAG: transposase [Cyanobacteria bacterium J06628_3]
MPNAQVVADRFHVMTQVNKELDLQRKREKREIEDSIKNEISQLNKDEYEKILDGLKKSKYALLKNEKGLNEEQIKKLAQVKEVSPTLKLMHDLKEKIRKIFDETDDWLVGLFELGLWLSKAKKHFPISQKTIIRWIDEIIAPAR